MTTYTQHTPDVRETETTPPPAQRTSPVLWAALAVALIAAVVWWSRQDRVATTPIATDTIPAATLPAGNETTPAAPAPAANRSQERARPVVADRAPRPLQGNPMPEYPRSALRSGSEGSVVVAITVGSDGVPTDVRVIERSGSRNRDLDRAAVDAARQWRFEPAIRDGKPTMATVQLPVDFRQQG